MEGGGGGGGEHYALGISYCLTHVHDPRCSQDNQRLKGVDTSMPEDLRDNSRVNV